jgi:hypothetical protein
MVARDVVNSNGERFVKNEGNCSVNRSNTAGPTVQGEPPDPLRCSNRWRSQVFFLEQGEGFVS